MKTIHLMIGMVAGYMLHIAVLEYQQETPEATKPQETSVELSIGGSVQYLKAPMESTIHIITDDNLELTDVQVIPDVPNTISIKPNGKSTNTTISSTGT